jgi:hypothetical protein
LPRPDYHDRRTGRPPESSSGRRDIIRWPTTSRRLAATMGVLTGQA